jgi:hypothetical protein
VRALVGSAGHRLFIVLIAIAVSMMLRPSELLAADAPTSARCGQSDDIVLHNPPRPAMLPRYHDTQLDDDWGDIGGPAELLPSVEPSGARTLPVIHGAVASLAARVRGRWRPPPRGPPV